MRTVLFLTWHFPPMAAVGVQRAGKFVRGLPAHGWRPHVVTAAGTGGYAQDASLLADLPGDVVVERTCAWTTSHAAALPAKLGLASLARYAEELLRVPDRHVPWIAAAVARGWTIVRRGPVDAIWSTSPPESTHVAALALAHATGLPWVADFRNEWTTHPEAGRALTPAHAALHRALEAAVVRRADRIVALNPAHAELLRRAYPRRAADVRVIENGIDPADLAGLEEIRPPADRFVLGYAGGLSDPGLVATFLRAVRERMARDEIDPARFELRLAGYLWRAETLVRTAPAWVRAEGTLPYRDALRLCRGSSALLLLQGRLRERVVPSKLYDYLAVGRPILAAVSPGTSYRDRLDACGRAVWADPSDAGAVGAALAGLVHRWRAGDLGPAPLPSVPVAWDRREQARALAGVLEEACERGGRRGGGRDRAELP